MQTLLTTFLDNQTLLWELIIQHLWLSVSTIILAMFFGSTIGILMTRFIKITAPITALVKIIYTIPSIAMFGFLLPFFDVGNQTAIIALTLYALLPMVMNTYSGINNINPSIIDAANAMGTTSWQLLWRIEIPLALPIILSGLRTMAVMTIALAGIASFIGAGGLGVMIYRGITTNNSGLTLLGSITVALLAFAIDGLLRFTEYLMTTRNRFSRITKLVFSGIGITTLSALLIFNFFINKDAEIRIATKPMTEQYILGQIIKQLIEHQTELTVSITQGVGGGTANIQPGMVSKQFDLYPEYTGTAWNAVLKEDSVYQEDKFKSLSDAYQQKFDFSWQGMYGFNNTYGLAIRHELAEKYGIRTYSELAQYSPNFTFAAEFDFFEREDGFAALEKLYGVRFKQKMDMDIGLKYQAINQGKIDVMTIFTTDGQLSQSDVVVLVDDKQLYPSYRAGNIVRNEILMKYPELSPILNKLNETITDSHMAQMNYQVEVEKREPSAVAEAFLQQSNLLNTIDSTQPIEN